MSNCQGYEDTIGGVIDFYNLHIEVSDNQCQISLVKLLGELKPFLVAIHMAALFLSGLWCTDEDKVTEEAVYICAGATLSVNLTLLVV